MPRRNCRNTPSLLNFSRNNFNDFPKYFIHVMPSSPFLLPQAFYYQQIFHDLWMSFSPKTIFLQFSQNHFEKDWSFENEMIFPDHCAWWIIVWKQNTVQSSWIIVLFQRRFFAFRFTISFQRPHINKPKSAHSVESRAGIKIASRKSRK